uniref:Uncharacterized protein n=1 Tax=Rhipicephalus microplus TaxID=6941 RepID=A0A6M2DB18_RHIMP
MLLRFRNICKVYKMKSYSLKLVLALLLHLTSSWKIDLPFLHTLLLGHHGAILASAAGLLLLGTSGTLYTVQ